MEIDKEAVEAAKNWRHGNAPSHPTVDYWADKGFLAGVKWERERIRERLREAADALNIAPLKSKENEGLFPTAEEAWEDRLLRVAVIKKAKGILDELLGEK